MMNLSGLPGAPIASVLVAVAVTVPLLGARTTEAHVRAAFGTGELLESCKRQSMGLVNAMLPREYVEALRMGATACVPALRLSLARDGAQGTRW